MRHGSEGCGRCQRGLQGPSKSALRDAPVRRATTPRPAGAGRRRRRARPPPRRAAASSHDRFGRSEHEHDLALRRLGEPRRELRGRAARDLLERLRQLAADGRAALRQRSRERAQRPRQPLRRLERHDRPRPARELVPQRRERLLSARQVADELVPLARRGRSRRAPSRPPTAPAAPSPPRPPRAPRRSGARPDREMPGIPASLTSAIRSPATSRGRSSAVRLASLCSW